MCVYVCVHIYIMFIYDMIYAILLSSVLSTLAHLGQLMRQSACDPERDPMLCFFSHGEAMSHL